MELPLLSPLAFGFFRLPIIKTGRVVFFLSFCDYRLTFFECISFYFFFLCFSHSLARPVSDFCWSYLTNSVPCHCDERVQTTHYPRNVIVTCSHCCLNSFFVSCSFRSLPFGVPFHRHK